MTRTFLTLAIVPFVLGGCDYTAAPSASQSYRANPQRRGLELDLIGSNGINLNGIDLNGIDLNGIDLNGINLNG
ncbi:MAG: hypothetical protein MJE77_13360, partial [Proteobacteria bacterium]|nr:hypothetical protein [Pseudomonadota bacterium]